MIADTEKGRFAAVIERDDAVSLMMSNGRRVSELTQEGAQVEALEKLVGGEAFRKRNEMIKRALAAYDIKEVWMDWYPAIVRFGWLYGLQAWLDWQDCLRTQAQPQSVKRTLGESGARAEENGSSQVSKKRKLIDGSAALPAAAAAPPLPKTYLGYSDPRNPQSLPRQCRSD